MAENIFFHKHSITKQKRAKKYKQKPCVLWFTGLSGSGKSTIANALEEILYDNENVTYLLDGDNIRSGLNKDLYFDKKSRKENIRRVAEVAKLFVDSGHIVLCAFISPYVNDRNMARSLMEDGEFIEIFIDTPLDICEKRDTKGLYKKAREGVIRDFTGIDLPYEKPIKPEIYIKNTDINIKEACKIILKYLLKNGYIVDHNLHFEKKLSCLEELEAESIHIIREAVAESKNPAMLYSVGKDSSVLLHLVQKAFYPLVPPLPMVHIDTMWKFKDMLKFRDKRAKEARMKLIVYTNPKGKDMNISPFIHGSFMHTDIMKTEALKNMIDLYKFDIILFGARRDEEKSRAKERIFSFRDKNHKWDPKKQRAELWNIYNTRHKNGESIRVFPLSNWTELDIWRYIQKENIPIVPLYFAKEREVVEYKGIKILVDDERVPEDLRKKAKKEMVRFRTLGCYPLTGAINSQSKTLSEIVNEIENAKFSEREGRIIDNDEKSSMEEKKREGYF